MNALPSLHSDRLSKLLLPPCTPELLTAGTYYDHPPTEFPVVQKPDDYKRPRTQMVLTIFRKALIREYLLRGLVRGEDGKLRLPERGSITKEEIDEISTAPSYFFPISTPSIPYTFLTRDRSSLPKRKSQIPTNLPNNGR